MSPDATGKHLIVDKQQTRATVELSHTEATGFIRHSSHFTISTPCMDRDVDQTNSPIVDHLDVQTAGLRQLNVS